MYKSILFNWVHYCKYKLGIDRERCISVDANLYIYQYKPISALADLLSARPIFGSAAAEMLSARLFPCQLLQKYYRLGCFPVSCCRSALGLADSFSARADLLSAQLIPIRLGLIYFRLGCFHFSCCRNVFGRVNSLSARAEMVSAERIASFLKPKCLFSSAMVFFLQLTSWWFVAVLGSWSSSSAQLSEPLIYLIKWLKW